MNDKTQTALDALNREPLPETRNEALRSTVIDLANHLRFETQLRWRAEEKLRLVLDGWSQEERERWTKRPEDDHEARQRLYAIDAAVKQLRARLRKDDCFPWGNGDILDIHIPVATRREVDELAENVMWLVSRCLHESMDSTVRWGNGEAVTTNAAGEVSCPSMGGN